MHASQFEQLLAGLTCREIVTYSGTLRLPPGTSKAEVGLIGGSLTRVCQQGIHHLQCTAAAALAFTMEFMIRMPQYIPLAEKLRTTNLGVGTHQQIVNQQCRAFPLYSRLGGRGSRMTPTWCSVPHFAGGRGSGPHPEPPFHRPRGRQHRRAHCRINFQAWHQRWGEEAGGGRHGACCAPSGTRPLNAAPRPQKSYIGNGNIHRLHSLRIHVKPQT